MSLPGGLQSQLWERPKPVCLPCTYRNPQKSWYLPFGSRHGIHQALPRGRGQPPPAPASAIACPGASGEDAVQLRLGSVPNCTSENGLLAFFSFIFTLPLCCFIPACFPAACRREPGMLLVQPGKRRLGCTSGPSPPRLAPGVSAERTDSPVINLSS